MTVRIAVASLLLLTACQSLPQPTCANAAHIRAAAVLVVQAIDKSCPANFGDQ